MSRTKSQFIADVRLLLDDKTDSTYSRWSDTEIEASIDYALSATVNVLFNAGYSDIMTRTNFQLDGSGVATIGPNDGIKCVYVSFGPTSVVRIPMGNGANRSLQGVPSSGTVMVEYIAKSSLPALSSDIVTYAGIDLDDPVIDKYTSYLAAMDLKTTEAEGNTQIEKMLPVLEAQIREKYTISVQVAPAVTWGMQSRFNTYTQSRWFRSSPTTIAIYC